MLTIAQTIITEKDLEKFLSDPYTIYNIKKANLSESEGALILQSVAENAEWIIDTILKETIQSIEDEYLRNWFKKYLVSVKYGILPQNTDTHQYSVGHAWYGCILINCPCVIKDSELVQPASTIILTPQGEIKTPEGEVLLDGNKPCLHGYYAEWEGLKGVYTWNGDVLLPCVFSDFSDPMQLEKPCTLIYKGFQYHFLLEGKREEMEPIDTDHVTNAKSSSIAFVSDDSVYSIEFVECSSKDDDPCNKLSIDEKKDMLTRNTKELNGIIRSIHPDCFPKALLRMKLKQSKEKNNG